MLIRDDVNQDVWSDIQLCVLSSVFSVHNKHLPVNFSSALAFCGLFVLKNAA